MTAHFDLHSTTFAQGVDADPTAATVKRSMPWLVPAGLLAVGAIAIATTIGNDDGTATVRSLTAAAPSAAPAADVWTGGEMSVRDATAAVADTNLATNTPNVWTGGEMSVRDAAASVADTNTNLGANSTIRSTLLTPDCDTERFC